MPRKSATAPEAAVGKAGDAVPGMRLVSLDAFRGFTMFWLVGGKPFFLALAALAGGPVGTAVSYELTHSAWEGLRFYDLIWPAFMLMVGVSVPFSFSRHRSEPLGRFRRRAWTRAAVLFLLGSLRESISTGAPCLVELSSALQPIALAYLVAAHLVARSWRVVAAVAALVLVVYGLALAFVAAPGIPAGTYEVNRNLVTALDEKIIGRAHAEGWGTALSAIPTISTTLLGLLFGKLLMSASAPRFRMKVMAAAGLGCLATGFALSPLAPVVMKLWTASYGLMSAGWACLIFLFFYWIIDVRGRRRWAFPLVVIGMNAIAAYLGPTIVPVHRIAGIFTKPLAQHIGTLGPLFSTGVVLLVNWSILWWMYRRKIFLRA